MVPCLDSIRDEQPDDVRDEAGTYWRFAGQEEMKAHFPGVSSRNREGREGVERPVGERDPLSCSCTRAEPKQAGSTTRVPRPAKCPPTAEWIRGGRAAGVAGVGSGGEGRDDQGPKLHTAHGKTSHT